MFINSKKTYNKFIFVSLITLLILAIGTMSFAATDISTLAGSASLSQSVFTYDTEEHRPTVSFSSPYEDIPTVCSVSYLDPINATDPSNMDTYVVIQGDGSKYTGVLQLPYTINKLDLVAEANNITFEVTGNAMFDGTVHHPTIVTSTLNKAGSIIQLKWDTAQQFIDLCKNTDMIDPGVYFVCINGDYNASTKTFVARTGTNYSGCIVRFVYIFPNVLSCSWSTPKIFTYDGQEHYTTPTINGASSWLSVTGPITRANPSKDVNTYDTDIIPRVAAFNNIPQEILDYYLDPDTFGWDLTSPIVQQNDDVQAQFLHCFVIPSGDTYLSSIDSLYASIAANQVTYHANANGDLVLDDPEGLIDPYWFLAAYYPNLFEDNSLYIETLDTTSQFRFEDEYEIVGKALTVKANDVTVNKGEALPTLDFTISGEVGTEKATKVGTASTTYDTSTAGVFDGAITVSSANIADNTSTGFKLSNYSVTYAPGKLTVEDNTPDELTITADNKTKYYKESDPELTAQVTGLKPGDTLTGSLTRDKAGTTAGEQAGTYDILQGTYGPSNPGDYSVTYQKGILTIKPINIEENPSDPDQPYVVVVEVSGTYTYNGNQHQPTPTVKLVDRNDPTIVIATLTPGTDYTVTYKNNINVGTPTSSNSPTVVITGNGTNYTSKQEVPFTITPRDVTLKVKDYTKIVKDPDPTPYEVEVTGGSLVTNETPGTTNITRVAGEDVPGPYAINLTEANITDNGSFKKSNYNITCQPGELTITPVNIPDATVVPPGSTEPTKKVIIEVGGAYTYNGDEHKPVPTVTMILSNGNTVTLVEGTDYELDYDNNIHAGDPDSQNPPVVKIIGKGPNFTGTEEVLFTIDKATLAVTATNVNIKVGDPMPNPFPYTTTGQEGTDVPAFDNNPTTTATDTNTSGDYPIMIDGVLTPKQTANFNPNDYNITYNDGILTISPIDKTPITPNDITITIPQDFIYNGEPRIPGVTVSVGGVDLVEGVDYTLEIINNVQVNGQDPNGNPTVIVHAIPTSPYSGNPTKEFDITPAKLKVEWNARDTFQYDGEEHIKIGRVVIDPTTPVFGETVDFTLNGEKIPVGEGYVAQLVINGIEGGSENLGNYELIPAEDPSLKSEFKITPLPIDTEEPTEEPQVPGEPLPDDDKPQNYTVEIVIEWPDTEEIYTGKEVTPQPDSVKLIIKNPSGEIYKETELGEDEYELIYNHNIDSNGVDPEGNPEVTIKGDGVNITGQITNPFTITPAHISVKADNKSKYVGQENPTLTMKVTGAVNNEVPKFTPERPTTDCEKDSPKGTYTIKVEDLLVPIENGKFKPDNYTYDYTDGILTVTTRSSGGGGGGTPSAKSNIDVSIYLSNDRKADKGNNNYYLLGEEVVYFVDYQNEKDAFKDTYKLTLELPLKFEAVELDGGKVSGQTITWTISGGMKKDETGRKTVKVKFTEFSKGNKKGYEDIYPVDKIYVGSKLYDECTIHNIIYTLDNDLETKHIIYMYGDEEKPTFRPDDIINRAEGALVLTRIFEIDTSKVAIKGDEYSDINDTYLKAQQAIVKASQLGLISGYEDGTYRPLQKMTRAEFMSIISRFVEYKSAQEGIRGMNIKEIQKDVNLYKRAGHWADKYVLLLARLNMAPEDIDTMESLNRKITRAEVAQLCNMYLLRAPVYDDGKIELPFTDVDSSHKLFSDIVEATRPTHDDFRLTEKAYEIWNH